MIHLSEIDNAMKYVKWMSGFELKLSFQHEVEDVEGPVLLNSYDGAHIDLGDKYYVTVSNESREFDCLSEATLWLWNVHSSSNWDLYVG